MRISSLVSGCQGLGVACLLLLGACTPGSGPGDEPLGTSQEAVFVNGGFETGAAGIAPPSWTVQTYLNPSGGITVQTPQTRAGLNLVAGGDAVTTQLNATNQPDPQLGAGASLRYCRYGAQCAVVNFHSSTDYNHGRNVNALSQSMTIAAGDVDPSDGQVHIRFAIAPVLENPGHTAQEQPYYFVQVTNTTKNTILYSDFNLSAQAGVPWKKVPAAGTTEELNYVDWSLVDVAPGSSKLAVGDSVTLEIIAAGCSLGGHFGAVYVDGVGSTVPGLFVSGVGPAQANPGTVVSYDMTYKNGSSANATGVVITLVTPPNTTFQAITPPAGATCVSPAVGAAGTITCTFAGAIAAAASGTFQVSVNLAGSATGTLVNGNYNIRSTQETALVGSKIVTTIGCTADANCAAGKWCKISANQCTPTLANGQAIPSDPPHVAPPLTAVCTAAAGTLVCQSGVCDTSDNLCGKKNGSSGCTVATQATICRSGVCDPDGACGYAPNHGPCTTSNAATVCRSGLCSANLLCQPVGGCNVDADCTSSQWCNQTEQKCTAKLSNGSSMPIDAPHTNPILNGDCSAAAGTLVCQSSVCDPDNKCGYADSSGPCTAGNAATVCRSGSCSSNLLCRPAGGCNVDADCSSAQWCNVASHACKAKLPNGDSIPVDPPHTNPVLDAKCTAAAGSLVCQASVCDTDDKCGKLNGSGTCTVANQATICRSSVCDAADGACGYATNHGPCTAANGATVCRSGSCSANLLCQPPGGCNVDADCTGGQWCNATSHTCSVKLTNGSSIPNDPAHVSPPLTGDCTAPAATLVCISSVCDGSDDKCGYAVNSGPCTAANAATVCRSGSCSSNLLCQPAGGCNVDADCTGGNWCNATLHACTPKLANNTAIPTDVPHQNPALSGVCTAAASALVCQSAVCDVADDKCGYDIGHGPCTAANGGSVCRSGACGTDGTCRPLDGCNLDADCETGKWCQQSSHTCAPKLANGSPLPTDPPHTNPALDGKCTTPAAALVCQSAVCDSADDQCGFATGHGPCTAANAAVVCRSASCSTNGLCQPGDGCNVDGDCAAGKWCNVAMGACLPRLANGTPLPTDAPHTSPTLDGTCSEAAASLVCVSGVCDTNDDECGFATGVGPCTAADGASVCRSGRCATSGASNGTCVDCSEDSHCSGDTKVCNRNSGKCVQCTSPGACSGTTPICDLGDSVCVKCNGDKGSTATHPCPTDAAPLCGLAGANAGACGKCTSDASCEGHAGNVCDLVSGLCKTGCRLDMECSNREWCNDSVGMCAPKIENGTPLPSEPGRVSTCSAAVGSIVCQSAVCDPADGKCGLTPGAGPCESSDQCRAGDCNAGTKQCSSGCTSNADCSSSEYCGSAGACIERLPVGTACTTSSQCKTNDCSGNVCSDLVASGAGVACATRSVGDSGADWGAGLVVLLIGAAASARRRRGGSTRAAA